jgi:putative spermidine/putrescine transport system permease protein
MEGRRTRLFLLVATATTLAFIYLPLALVAAYALNPSGTSAWPPAGVTLKWFGEALRNTGLQQAFLTSLGAAVLASSVAVVLGTLAALGVARNRFFGRETISLAVIFPIALPGIVTGMALSTTFGAVGFGLGFATIVVGHATFCVVLVYNNAVARLRRTAGSIEEASADLGAHAFQTFRYVTLPALRSAMLAGFLLAFALSFDEVIVTIFVAGGVKTLPIWIFQSFRLANQVPLVNVAGVFAILLSVIPVYVASRISAGAGTVR